LGGLGVLPREITIVFWFQLATGNSFDITAFYNPIETDGR
jgi:hypothetical protein